MPRKVCAECQETATHKIIIQIKGALGWYPLCSVCAHRWQETSIPPKIYPMAYKKSIVEAAKFKKPQNLYFA